MRKLLLTLSGVTIAFTINAAPMLSAVDVAKLWLNNAPAPYNTQGFCQEAVAIVYGEAAQQVGQQGSGCATINSACIDQNDQSYLGAAGIFQITTASNINNAVVANSILPNGAINTDPKVQILDAVYLIQNACNQALNIEPNSSYTENNGYSWAGEYINGFTSITGSGTPTFCTGIWTGEDNQNTMNGLQIISPNYYSANLANAKQACQLAANNQSINTPTSNTNQPQATAINQTVSSCKGIASWSSSQTYSSSGTVVQYNGVKYQNQWYINSGTLPTSGQYSGWKKIGSCATPIASTAELPW